MVTSIREQVDDPVQEHQMQVHRPHKVNHQVVELLLLHHVALLSQPHRSHQKHPPPIPNIQTRQTTS